MVFPMPMLGSRLVMLVTVLDGKDNERKEKERLLGRGHWL